MWWTCQSAFLDFQQETETQICESQKGISTRIHKQTYDVVHKCLFFLVFLYR